MCCFSLLYKDTVIPFWTMYFLWVMLSQNCKLVYMINIIKNFSFLFFLWYCVLCVDQWFQTFLPSDPLKWTNVFTDLLITGFGLYCEQVNQIAIFHLKTFWETLRRESSLYFTRFVKIMINITLCSRSIYLFFHVFNNLGPVVFLWSCKIGWRSVSIKGEHGLLLMTSFVITQIDWVIQFPWCKYLS